MTMSTNLIPAAAFVLAATFGVRVAAWILSRYLFAKRHPIRLRPQSFALVTGSTKGIGFEMAKVMARRGLNVILTGRSEDSVSHAVEKLKALFPTRDIRGIVLHMQDSKAAERAVETIFQDDNVIVQVVVLNANIEHFIQLERTKVDLLTDILQSNVVTETILLHRILNHFLNHKSGGYIFGMSSIATFFDFPTGIPYVCSRSYQSRMYQLLGQRIGKVYPNIHIANVEVGPVATESLLSHPALKDDKNHPMLRLAKPPDAFAEDVIHQVMDRRRTHYVPGLLWQVLRRLHFMGVPIRSKPEHDPSEEGPLMPWDVNKVSDEFKGRLKNEKSSIPCYSEYPRVGLVSEKSP